ncbi:hypothetical protein VTN49DRAFT_5692 [Thermomyces lanuginosus]|uniref:uncharacterized protein n=1 Tax=Thermomyces lanuginosus TaxID=5541 RepID=UPI00374227B0
MAKTSAITSSPSASSTIRYQDPEPSFLGGRFGGPAMPSSDPSLCGFRQKATQGSRKASATQSDRKGGEGPIAESGNPQARQLVAGQSVDNR